MIVYGEHRSLELAERHARELSRIHGQIFQITARRKASGAYSARGHYFTFESEEGRREYLLNFDYGTKRNQSSIGVEVHLFGPSVGKERVAEIYRQWFQSGTLPEGWSVAAVDWNRPTGEGTASTPAEIKKARKRLAFVLRTRPEIR